MTTAENLITIGLSLAFFIVGIMLGSIGDRIIDLKHKLAVPFGLAVILIGWFVILMGIGGIGTLFHRNPTCIVTTTPP